MPASPAAATKPRPAIHQCAWTYETGRKCRRIAGRGQQFCPGHRRPGPRLHIGDDPAFHQEIDDWIDRLLSMDLPAVLYALHCSLAEIEPILARKASRRSRLAFERASIAVMAGRERLVIWLSGYRPEPALLPGLAVAAPPPSPIPAPNLDATALAQDPAALAQDPAALARLAGSIPEHLSPEQLSALCDTLLNILKTQ